MRILVVLLLGVGLLAGCKDDSETSAYTGRSIRYNLYSGTPGGSDGTVTFMERTDKSVDIVVKLTDLSGSGNLPVHLHVGDLSNPNAPYAAFLVDYDIEKGESVTHVDQLADETPFTLDRVGTYDGSVKVHLASSGPDKNVIIAAGNIGSNEIKGFNLQSIAVCGDDLIGG